MRGFCADVRAVVERSVLNSQQMAGLRLRTSEPANQHLSAVWLSGLSSQEAVTEYSSMHHLSQRKDAFSQ